MTRINVGIPAQNLTDEHLIAEHREIKRIPNTWRAELAKNIPTTFRFGPGHVKFFYDKLAYLFVRYIELHNECKKRGFNVEFYGDSFTKHKQHSLDYWKQYVASYEDTKLTVERISTRILTGKLDSYHYYGKQISKQFAILKLAESL